MARRYASLFIGRAPGDDTFARPATKATRKFLVAKLEGRRGELGEGEKATLAKLKATVTGRGVGRGSARKVEALRGLLTPEQFAQLQKLGVI